MGTNLSPRHSSYSRSITPDHPAMIAPRPRRSLWPAPLTQLAPPRHAPAREGDTPPHTCGTRAPPAGGSTGAVPGVGPGLRHLGFQPDAQATDEWAGSSGTQCTIIVGGRGGIWGELAQKKALQRGKLCDRWTIAKQIKAGLNIQAQHQITDYRIDFQGPQIGK